MGKQPSGCFYKRGSRDLWPCGRGHNRNRRYADPKNKKAKWKKSSKKLKAGILR